MTRLESAPSGIDAARSRVMTRILSRFHRFLCPPPHWRSVGLKPILFNRRPGTRRTEPSPRRPRRPTGSDRQHGMFIAYNGLRDAPHRSRNGSPTLGSQPRQSREASLSACPPPLRRSCPEPKRDERRSIATGPPAEQPAPATAPAERGMQAASGRQSPMPLPLKLKFTCLPLRAVRYHSCR